MFLIHRSAADPNARDGFQQHPGRSSCGGWETTARAASARLAVYPLILAITLGAIADAIS